ncbi:hypothetical protein D9M68_878900 [compost metagenome]
MGEQVEVLEDEADVLAQLADQPLLVLQRLAGVDLDLADLDQAAAGFFQQVEAAQQGGLARAAGADDGHHFARRHGQVDALEHLLALEGFGQVTDGDHQLSCSCWLTRASRRPWKCDSTVASTQ